jgi:hypothetical protein
VRERGGRSRHHQSLPDPDEPKLNVVLTVC